MLTGGRRLSMVKIKVLETYKKSSFVYIYVRRRAKTCKDGSAENVVRKRATICNDVRRRGAKMCEDVRRRARSCEDVRRRRAKTSYKDMVQRRAKTRLARQARQRAIK